MKTKSFLCLCIVPFCGLSETPARDYTMVPFPNGPTSTMLEIGTTSFTFVIEWASDISTLGKLDLVGKLDLDSDAWSALIELDLDSANKTDSFVDWHSRFPTNVDQDQKKATFEILYDEIPWYYMEETKSDFAQRAFFSVNFSVSEEDWRKVYWNNDMEEEGGESLPVATAEVGVQDGKVKMSSTNREDELGTRDKELGIEDGNKASRLWLCLGILFGMLCTVLYFVRKKFSKN